MNWTKQKAYLTGMNQHSKIDNVNGINPMCESSEFHNKYQDAYRGGTNGSVFLGKQNFTNPCNNLHNNINDHVLKEQYFDNKIFIDSQFKDHSKHYDPYAFIVKLNGIEPVIEKRYIDIDGITYDYSIYLEGDTHVVLPKAFKNIKCINVNALIMPQYTDYESNDDGSYKPSNRQLARKYKYLLLKINELENHGQYSNNKYMGKECFIMKPYCESGINNEIWNPIHKTVNYFDSRLKTLNRLTVEICTDRGERLCTKLDGLNHDFHAEYRQLINKVIELRNNNTIGADEIIRKLVPKLDSLKEITMCINPEIHLTFNTIEPQIDTVPLFDV